MLDLGKIEQIAQSYSPQELFAALVWQRRFNEFDGQEVITDLAHHPELWQSFLFSKPIYAPDKHGLSFNGVLDSNSHFGEKLFKSWKCQYCKDV